MRTFILIQSLFIYILLMGYVFVCQYVVFSVLNILHKLKAKSPFMVNPCLSMCTVNPQLYQNDIKTTPTNDLFYIKDF